MACGVRSQTLVVGGNLAMVQRGLDQPQLLDAANACKPKESLIKTKRSSEIRRSTNVWGDTDRHMGYN